jgi:hypothetical protein
MVRLHPKRLFFAILLVGALQAGGGQALAYPSWKPYHWPVKPFNTQHPVQAAFGDPRTLYPIQPFGRTGPNLIGASSFHNGIDITAAAGTPVYPVVSGKVTKAQPDLISVTTADGRIFQYYHLDGTIKLGARVTAQRTVIGTVKTKYRHVHMAEIDGTVVHNPLAPGHLTPYTDWTKPTIAGVYIDNGGGPRALVANHVGSRDKLVVAASDPPAQPLTGTYAGLPQVPALVEWRLIHGGPYTHWTAAADFRLTEPPRGGFWQIYTPGTYQNLPVFDHRCFMTTPGRYLFRLGLNPARLVAGNYRLQVRVSDIRKNTSSVSWPLQIGKPKPPE